MTPKVEVPSRFSPEEQKELAIQQFRAGICLIEKSRLLKFDKGDFKFEPVLQDQFEREARTLDPDFGRVMLWLWFSTGAEYLLKGYMILQDPEFLKQADKPLPLLPMSSRPADWANKIIRQQEDKAIQNIFGTLQVVDGLKGRLDKQVGDGIPQSPQRAIEIEAIYSILRSAIRNRDSHAYVMDVRLAHFHMTNDFAPAFNDLLRAAGLKTLLGDSK